MTTSNVEYDGLQIVPPGSSAADSIGQQMDRARTEQEQHDLLTSRVPFTLTIKDFDRFGRIWCKNVPSSHTDQEPVEVSITEQRVQTISQSVTSSMGASFSSTLTAQAGVEIGAASSSTSASATSTVSAERSVARQVTQQLTTSIGIKEKVSVRYHAPECHEVENPYGLCLEVTVKGVAVFVQNAKVVTGSDGRHHWELQNSARIESVEISGVDTSLDPCVKAGTPTKIPDCIPSKKERDASHGKDRDKKKHGQK